MKSFLVSLFYLLFESIPSFVQEFNTQFINLTLLNILQLFCAAFLLILYILEKKKIYAIHFIYYCLLLGML